MWSFDRTILTYINIVWLAVYCWFDNLMHIENIQARAHKHCFTAPCLVVHNDPMKETSACVLHGLHQITTAGWGRTSGTSTSPEQLLLLSHTHRHTHMWSSASAVCVCLFVYVCQHMNFLFSSSSWERASVLTTGHQLCSIFFWSAWTYTHTSAHSSCVVNLIRCSGLHWAVLRSVDYLCRLVEEDSVVHNSNVLFQSQLRLAFILFQSNVTRKLMQKLRLVSKAPFNLMWF